MNKGVHLTLMVGPSVPIPAPRPLVEALVSVEVQAHSSLASAFTLKFSLSKRSVLSTLMLLVGGGVPKNIRVLIMATCNGLPEVLIDGVVVEHDVAPGSDGETEMTVTGEDLRRVMDYDDLTGLPFPSLSSNLIVTALLAKYAAPWGVVPLVIPPKSLDAESPLDMSPHQKGTDLCYINWLACQCGHTFFIRPGPIPGVNVAYWGPDIKIGPVQRALNYDMDVHTNVESLSFKLDGAKRTDVRVNIQEPITKATIPAPIPPIDILNPPLGIFAPPAKRTKPLTDASHLSPVKGLLRGLSEASKSANAVMATGRLDVARYGGLLKPRCLVGVRGAGLAFDGLYYVESVKHEIERGQYKQSFSLSRNGLISTLPLVPA